MFLLIDGISFSYPGSGIMLFSDLSLSFSQGWTVIAGANGVGKSTLMSIAAGELEPDNGRVRRSGDAILCPQVFDGLRPEDWADIFSSDNHVGMLKSTLSITDEMIEREHELSGGEKKRLQLLPDPRVALNADCLSWTADDHGRSLAALYCLYGADT